MTRNRFGLILLGHDRGSTDGNVTLYEGDDPSACARIALKAASDPMNKDRLLRFCDSLFFGGVTRDLTTGQVVKEFTIVRQTTE